MNGHPAENIDAEGNPKLSELREVKVSLSGASGYFSNTYIVHESEVDRLVEASKRLHNEPGINPHNGGKTAKLLSIDVSKLGYSGPYWWSTPDLRCNYDSRGARIIGERDGRAVYLDKSLLNKTYDTGSPRWHRVRWIPWRIVPRHTV